MALKIQVLKYYAFFFFFFNGGSNLITKYYPNDKFFYVNLSLKLVGEGWESWGKVAVYKLEAAFGNSAERFLPAQWLPQHAICAKRVDDFLHKH